MINLTDSRFDGKTFADYTVRAALHQQWEPQVTWDGELSPELDSEGHRDLYHLRIDSEVQCDMDDNCHLIGG